MSKQSHDKMYSAEEEGHARTQNPQNRNYVVKLSTFGIIVGVNPTLVQWKGLTLGKPSSWSWFIPLPGKYEQQLGKCSIVKKQEKANITWYSMQDSFYFTWAWSWASSAPAQEDGVSIGARGGTSLETAPPGAVLLNVLKDWVKDRRLKAM